MKKNYKMTLSFASKGQRDFYQKEIEKILTNVQLKVIGNWEDDKLINQKIVGVIDNKLIDCSIQTGE